MSESTNDCNCPSGKCAGEKSAGNFLSGLQHYGKARQCEEIRKKLHEMRNPGEPPEVSRVHDGYPDCCEPKFIEVLQEALNGGC